MKTCIAILLCLSISAIANAQDKFIWVPWNKLTAKVKAELKTVKVDKQTTLYASIMKYKKEGVKDDDIIVAVLDMDKDGKPEYAVFITNSAYCGTAGCSFNAYKDGGKKQIHFHDEIDEVKPSKNGVISSSGVLMKFE